MIIPKRNYYGAPTWENIKRPNGYSNLAQVLDEILVAYLLGLLRKDLQPGKDGPHSILECVTIRCCVRGAVFYAVMINLLELWLGSGFMTSVRPSTQP